MIKNEQDGRSLRLGGCGTVFTSTSQLLDKKSTGGGNVKWRGCRGAVGGLYNLSCLFRHAAYVANHYRVLTRYGLPAPGIYEVAGDNVVMVDAVREDATAHYFQIKTDGSVHTRIECGRHFVEVVFDAVSGDLIEIATDSLQSDCLWRDGNEPDLAARERRVRRLWDG